MDPSQSVKRDGLVALGQLIGSYRVERLLGEGGMAMVFLAVHERIRKRAAIKVLKAPYSHDPDIVTRFLHEALAVNLIQHPGLINIFEHGALDNGAPYIMMDYLEGVSLSQRLAERRSTVAETLRIGRQIALALSAAHDKGVIHRDLKPANIMLVPDANGDEQAKVLDFGIAKLGAATGAIAITSAAQGFMGTPGYAAPEQCFGAGKVTTKSDVYALGIILYEMLAGRGPFTASDSADMLSHHVYTSPPPLQAACPNVAPALCTLVHAMLSKEQDRRPGMGEVAAELQRFSEAGDVKPVIAAVASAVHVAGRTIRSSGAVEGPSRTRNRRLRLLAALLGIVLLGALVRFGLTKKRSATAGIPTAPPQQLSMPKHEPVVATPALGHATPPPAETPPLPPVVNPHSAPIVPTPPRRRPVVRVRRPTNEEIPLLK